MDWQQASTSSGSTGGPCTGGTLHSYELVSTQAVRQNVFLGRQREPEGERVHLVAIKRVQFDRLNAIQLEQQVKEVRLTALLRHPNVMPILSSFVRLNELWIVFPVANYLSCKELAVPFGLNEPAIAFIARDVLRGTCHLFYDFSLRITSNLFFFHFYEPALTYLHERGIVHLGIRGSRILVDSSGQCRLAGLKYSLSMIRNARLQSTLYQYPNNATVNLKWLSPEVLEQNLYGYNEKSDIYSLGITCCELANGCTPFKGMPASQILIDKLTGNAPRPLDSTCVQLDEVISGKYIFHFYTCDLFLIIISTFENFVFFVYRSSFTGTTKATS